MTSTLPAVPTDGAWAVLQAADNPTARYEAGQWATTAVAVPGFTAPVPPLFFDLPWNDDNDEIVAGILANLAATDDIAQASEAGELRDPADLCGRNIQVLGVAARRSDVDDAKWGAYLSITASVDGGLPEVLNTGAGQVVVVLWRCYCEGQLPVSGTFVKLGSAKQGRSQPLGFQIDRAF